MDTTPEWPRLVGGNAALDFANTAIVASDDPDADILSSAGSLLAWATYAGVTDAALPTEGRSGLAQARRLRQAILELATARASGTRPPTDALDELQSAYADAVRRARPAVDGQLSWTWPDVPPILQVLYPIADLTVELFRRGPMERLKACDSCGFVFLDASKNNSRRWCSMDDCGKQVKMRRYVARRAAKRSRVR